MSTITTTQIRDLLLPGLNKIFGEYPQLPKQWSEVFDKSSSDMAVERDVEMKLLGLAQLRSEGAATQMDSMGERYQSVYRHIQVALGFVVTRNAIRDNLYKKQFAPSAKALRNSIAQTEEVYGASVLNNAATSGYEGGDGVVLLSTAHPIETGTVANTPSVQAQLNETSLTDGLVAVRRFRDAAGLRAMIGVDKLIVPPELQWTAERLTVTQLRVGTADNDINAVRSRGALPGGFVINDFISNTSAWFLKTKLDDALRYFERDSLESDAYVDFSTDNLQVKATKRFSFGYSNFRGLYGSMP
jgi:hypothetical protein